MPGLRSRRVIQVQHGADDYTRCFGAALRGIGLQVIDGEWSGTVLWRTVRPGDVVHIHWPSFLYYDRRSLRRTYWQLLKMFAILLAVKRRGAHIAWTAHNRYPHDGGAALRCHRLARRVLARTASVICVHGAHAEERVRAEFGVPRSKLLRIPHGHWVGYYPNTLTREDARRQLGVPPEAHVSLFVGVCKPYKNLEGLCRAFMALPADSLLLIAGRFRDARYREEITGLARRLAADRIRVYDRFIPSEELQLYLNACDVVVLPYREILTSGTAILALGFGRPVVAPGFGFLREVVPAACGELYDPGEPDGLARALTRARSRTFDAARIVDWVEQFDWTTSATRFKQRIEGL